MKDLIIIGAGNVGGFLALNQDLFEEKFNIIGFLDDDENKLGQHYWGIPVIGKVSDLQKYKNVAIAIGIANPRIKKELLKEIKDDIDFPNFIAKNAWISNKVSLGKGIIIYPNVSVNHESEIGDFVIMNMNCAIGHNSVIGKGCSLAPGVNFAGFTKVYDFVEIGIGVSTIQQVEIGEGAIVGGQSMVVQSLEPHLKYIGIPAKKI